MASGGTARAGMADGSTAGWSDAGEDTTGDARPEASVGGGARSTTMPRARNTPAEAGSRRSDPAGGAPSTTCSTAASTWHSRQVDRPVPSTRPGDPPPVMVAPGRPRQIRRCRPSVATSRAKSGAWPRPSRSRLATSASSSGSPCITGQISATTAESGAASIRTQQRSPTIAVWSPGT
ncbi:MAG TPA: hypothetical protein VFW50_22385 [Streptosporangiaceae bacterium]|nr:hypothetical protein [Streptosporangiaceae bacterium]